MKRRRIDWPRVGFALLSAWAIYEMANTAQIDVPSDERPMVANEGWR